MSKLVLLTPEETGEILGLAPKTLENQRCAGDGPPWLRVGTGPKAPIRYEQTALYAWISAQAEKAAEEMAAKRAKKAA